MDLKNMDKEALLEGVKVWVKREKESTLVVLEYLAEIDRHRYWLEEGYSSLHDFCVRYLGYSEGEAARRMHAARCVAAVPEVKPLIKENRISLSAVSLIAPHITSSNAPQMLPLVESQPTRRISEILTQHFDVPAQEEVLRLPLDPELKSLLQEVAQHYSEKDRVVLIKRALKSVLVKKATRSSQPARHTRYVPQAVRREVKTRSDNQCSFQSPMGVRCNQTAHLEMDHIRPWGKGGSSWDAGNLRLLCRAHNQLEGRLAFPSIAREMLGTGSGRSVAPRNDRRSPV